MEDRDLKNIVWMTETAWRKLMAAFMDNLIQSYTDIITGDNTEEVINEDLNKIKYNDYDVMRKIRNELIAIRNQPAHIIEMLTENSTQRDHKQDL